MGDDGSGTKAVKISDREVTRRKSVKIENEGNPKKVRIGGIEEENDGNPNGVQVTGIDMSWSYDGWDRLE